MATPGETAIPCSFCMRLPLRYSSSNLPRKQRLPARPTACSGLLAGASSDNSSPWAAPSVMICNTSVAFDPVVALGQRHLRLEAARQRGDHGGGAGVQPRAVGDQSRFG